MDSTSEIVPLRDREIFYYRQRNKNRVFEKIATLFVQEAERRGITKKQIADLLRKDTGQISRWLSGPNNLTLDTISDILLALGAEMEYAPARFDDRPKQNYFHPLMGNSGQRKEAFKVDSTSHAVETSFLVPKPGINFKIGTSTETVTD